MEVHGFPEVRHPTSFLWGKGEYNELMQGLPRTWMDSLPRMQRTGKGKQPHLPQLRRRQEEGLPEVRRDWKRIELALFLFHLQLLSEGILMNNVFSLQKTFESKVFRIPDYQRGYAWEEQHLVDLWEDIEFLTSGKRHYTGNLVLQKCAGKSVQAEDGSHHEVFDIVDGQQRLILLC